MLCHCHCINQTKSYVFNRLKSSPVQTTKKGTTQRKIRVLKIRIHWSIILLDNCGKEEENKKNHSIGYFRFWTLRWSERSVQPHGIFQITKFQKGVTSPYIIKNWLESWGRRDKLSHDRILDFQFISRRYCLSIHGARELEGVHKKKGWIWTFFFQRQQGSIDEIKEMLQFLVKGKLKRKQNLYPKVPTASRWKIKERKKKMKLILLLEALAVKIMMNMAIDQNSWIVNQKIQN